jgi:extracellular factor (EF) 3-hydroxypalmitic acid methyl ester biosynthesis protein
MTTLETVASSSPAPDRTLLEGLTGQAADSHDRSVSQVRAACQRLESLAAGVNRSPERTFHGAVSAIHDLCLALDEAESAGVPSSVLRELTRGAREVHGRSPFIRRLQEWPRGYPGDFETIERLCRADNHAPAGTLAHVLETYALSAAISQQHRNKVALQASWIREAMRRGANPRVLSIACGSCPDLRSVAEDVPDGAAFVLCDGDANALEFSRVQLGPLAEQCVFVHGNVPRVLRRLPRSERYDLIFAGGLFDYLPDRFIIRTLHDAWHDLLAPGGRLAFTNIARGNPFRVWLEYVGSWPLIERSEADLIALCAAADIPVAPRVTHDDTGLSIIATLTKEQAICATPYASITEAGTP